MVYWLLNQGDNRALLKAVRAYLIGVVGLLMITFLMGGIAGSMQENTAGQSLYRTQILLL